MKKYILTALIFIFIAILVIGGIWLVFKPDQLSPKELAFLKQEGFLDENGEPFKSPNLIEQNINASDESFQVLATKLNKSNGSYQLAFKLENKSNEKKEFYLIPVSERDQLEFKEIKGVINNKNLLSINKDDVSNQPLESLYDIKQHKKELNPELARAYDDIDNNNYQGDPIKIILDSNSSLVAKSGWEVKQDKNSEDLKPVYFLVYGSAGGVKEELTILTIHSHPSHGDDWSVNFTTVGIADLRIVPDDQETIDDDEFTGLFCDNEERFPQILENDIIYYPDWECKGISKVVHYTKKAGKHTLRIEFGDETKYAYNASIVRYVDPDADGEGDGTSWEDAYTSLSAWEAAEQQDLTDNGGDTMTVYCRSSAGTDDTTAFTIDTWVTSATNYITIVGNDFPSDGVFDDTKYVLSVTDDFAICIYENYVRVQNIQVEVKNTSTNAGYGFWFNNISSGGSDIRIDSCILKGNAGGTGNMYGIASSDSDATINVFNTVIYGFDTSDGFGTYINGPTLNVYNSTIHSCSYGHRNQDGTSNFKNCAVFNNGNDFITYGGTMNIDHCASDDGDGTNAQDFTAEATDWNKVFNGYASGDVSLKDYTTTPCAVGQGTDDPGGGLYSDDINGAARTSAWDIGAFEYVNTTAITSVHDFPDPEEVGNDITFSVDWDDTEGIKMLICKSDAITAATPACDDGEWCSNKDDYDSTDPITCTYTLQPGDIGSNDYYAFVCDDAPLCSLSASGTFTAKAAISPSLKFKGGTNFKGGIIIK